MLETANQSLCHLDSHADTCCFGQGALIIAAHEKTVDITPFDPSLGLVNKVPIVDIALAYDHPDTGELVILTFNQVPHV